MKLSFGPSLPLGQTSDCEFLDVAINEAELSGTSDSWRQELQAYLPEDITIKSIELLDESTPSLAKAIDRALYEITIPAEFAPPNGKLARFLQMEKIEIEKASKEGTSIIDIKGSIESLNRIDLSDSSVKISLYELVTIIGQVAYATPALVLKALLGCDWQTVPGLRIHRKKLYSSTGSL
jgi:radical SAM-linked protein